MYPPTSVALNTVLTSGVQIDGRSGRALCRRTGTDELYLCRRCERWFKLSVLHLVGCRLFCPTCVDLAVVDQAVQKERLSMSGWDVDYW